MASQSTNPSPKVSLISVCYKRHDLLDAYLSSIGKYEPREDMEIIVVDVDAEPNNRDKVNAWCDTYLYTERAVCYSVAVNMGLNVAQGEYLVWGNEDIEVSGPFIDTLLGPIKENIKTITGRRLGRQDGHDYIAGWLVAMHRNALDDVGYLDNRFPGTFEDVEYCVRAQDNGYRLKQVVIPVRHIALGRLNDYLFTGLRTLREICG